MDASRAAALKRGVNLEAVTIAWMLVEAAVALGAGIAARSVLLTAFGADSVIELISGFVLYRRLSLEAQGNAGQRFERVEKSAARISAILLLLLCAYVVITSLAGLLLRVEPSPTPIGIAITALAIVAMPALAWAKRDVNQVLQSGSLRADIAETVTCAYLAAVTLGGLLAAVLLGWWWIQYIAAVLLLVWLIPETREAQKEARDNGAIQGDRG